MFEENLHLDEEAIKATPHDGSGSEDDEFAKLFEVEEAPEGESLEEMVKRQGEVIARMQKGIAKAFSEKGKKESKENEQPEKKSEQKSDDSSDLEILFFEQRPEASLVSDDLKRVAKAQGISILQAWKNETWLHDKAKALASEKSEEEKNRGKIHSPSGTTGSMTGMSFEKVDLENPEHVKWLNSKGGRRAEFSKWFATNGLRK